MDAPSDRNFSAPEHKLFDSRSSLQEFVRKCEATGKVVAPALTGSARQQLNGVDYEIAVDGLNEIIEHSVQDQVISVGAGLRTGALAAMLEAHRQWFPLPSKFAGLRLDEVIYKGLSGSLETRFGGLRELVLGVDVLLSNGEVIRCGGKVVKNVSGYDLTKLFLGSYGTFGLVLSAHLRLFALPQSSLTLAFGYSSAAEALTAARQVLRAGLPVSCLEIAPSQFLELLPRAGENLCLIVQLHGAPELISELAAALSGIINNDAPLAVPDETEIWQRLNEPAAIEPFAVVQSKNTLLLELAADWRIKDWNLRPAANKLIMHSNPCLPDLITCTTELCRRHETSAEIACPTETKMWQVHYLPQDDPGRALLSRRIKAEFDPRGTFNPLVAL